MRKRSILSFLCVMALLVTTGCSSSGFLVVQDAPKGALPNQTLGLRAVVDTGALSPTERYSWLELCEKVVTPSLKFFTSTKYVNCEPVVHLTQVAQKTTTTGWVAGVVGPVIQTGMIAGSVAYAGHEIGRGIAQSGSKTTNNTTNGNSNSNTANGGNGGVGEGGAGGAGGAGGKGGKGGHGGDGGSSSSSVGNVGGGSSSSSVGNVGGGSSSVGNVGGGSSSVGNVGGGSSSVGNVGGGSSSVGNVGGGNSTSTSSSIGAGGCQGNCK